MSRPVAGVIMSAAFVRPGGDAYGEYIEYMGRSNAIRNEMFDKYNAFDPSNLGVVGNAVDGASEAMFGEYNEYMANPEKTEGLFSRNYDQMPQEAKDYFKSYFNEGRENESPLWQIVFSFRNDWLAEHGLMNLETGEVDGGKLQGAVRVSMNHLEKKEKLNGEWTGAIHHNTEHVHVHVGYVEKNPTREYFHYIDKINPEMSGWQYKGKFLKNSIKGTRSKFVNQLLEFQVELANIDKLIKQTISEAKENKHQFVKGMYQDGFERLYEKMPKNKSRWKYGYAKNQGFKNEVDNLVNLYLNTDGKNLVTELRNQLEPISNEYERAYGNPKNEPTFLDRQIYGKEGLYHKLGNVILNEVKEFDKKNEKRQSPIGNLSLDQLSYLELENNATTILDHVPELSSNFDFDSLAHFEPPVENELINEIEQLNESLGQEADYLLNNYDGSEGMEPPPLEVDGFHSDLVEVKSVDMNVDLESLISFEPPEYFIGETGDQDEEKVSTLDTGNTKLKDASARIYDFMKARRESVDYTLPGAKDFTENQSVVPVKRGVRVNGSDFKIVTIKPIEEVPNTLTESSKEILPSSEKIVEFENGKNQNEKIKEGNLNDFSKHNKKLILQQNPDATYVFGKHQWLLKKREISEGTEPIIIIAPVFEEGGGKPIGFEPIQVFDISQTERGLSKTSLKELEAIRRNSKKAEGSKIQTGASKVIDWEAEMESRKGLNQLKRSLENKGDKYLNELAYEKLKREIATIGKDY
ncbi:MAG: MobP2 family relaxase [Vagococcus sp.]|uniref:MobP2 family relaxase n=1 Tax=Vagococcus sp. TaxID=1933889 RepID=UPI002FC6EE67